MFGVVVHVQCHQTKHFQKMTSNKLTIKFSEILMKINGEKCNF